MNQTQKKNLFIFSVILSSIIVLAYFAYGEYKQRVEEGLVYISLFKPSPYIKEFEEIIVFSNPSVCGVTNKARYKDYPQDMLSNFIRLNAEGASPIKLSILEGKVPIVSWEDTKNIHKKGIETFLNPKGLRVIRLSRVGFNKGRNKAIACVEYKGGRHWNEHIFYFEKIKKKWEFAEF